MGNVRSDTPAEWVSPGGVAASTAVRTTGRAPAAVGSTDIRQPEPLHPERDTEFARLRQIYCSRGGLPSGDEVAQLMRALQPQPTSLLARLIVDRRIVHVTWRSLILIPLFQFTPQWLVHPAVTGAIAELADVLDDWEIAMWFAGTNTWLQHERPLDLVTREGTAVIHAARTERFIVQGC